MGTLIDSSIFIAAERGDAPLRSALALLNPFEDCFISVVTVFELLHGVYQVDTPTRRSAREAHAERFIQAIPIIPFDESAARVLAPLDACDLAMRRIARSGTPGKPRSLAGGDASWLPLLCLTFLWTATWGCGGSAGPAGHAGSGSGGAVLDGGIPGTGGAPDGGGTGARDSGTGGAAAVACASDITAAILANQNLTLAGDSCVNLPAAITTYDGVISGTGTLRLRASSGPGTLILTGDSTFTLPDARQTETAIETKSPTDPNHVHYFVIQTPNPPAVFIEPNATLQLGTPASTTGTIGNYIPNTNGITINLDNIEVNGTLVLESGPTQHLGILSGAGIIRRPAIGSAGGAMFLVGDNPFSGVYSQLYGGYFGSDHVIFSMPAATIFSNESFIVAAPQSQFGASVTHLLKFPQTIWESHYGDDVNTDSGHIVFSGVYSYSNSGDQLRPALSDSRLNAMVVQNVTGSPTGGSNSSFRGVNIESGTTEWGDGTTSAFFLPSTPAPAAPDSTVKNAYINLHNAATLVFNYDATYTCNVGITGGGGGPRADGSVGVGNLTIAATPGNTALLTMPQNYNGTTTIGVGATLQIGNGAQVQALKATVGAPTAAEPFGAVTGTAVVATYTGDSSLLTAESVSGAATDNIVNNGHLIVNNTSTAITLSHISGAGTFTQTGPASVTVLANNYGGGTDIRGGVLLAADARALGTGDVTNEAVLTTSGDQRIINVSGDYHQGARARLRLVVAATTSPGPSLTVAGRADLDGRLELSPREGALAWRGDRRALVVVRAGGGIRGRFGSIVVEDASGVRAADLVARAHYTRTTCTVTVRERPPAALVDRFRRPLCRALQAGGGAHLLSNPQRSAVRQSLRDPLDYQEFATLALGGGAEQVQRSAATGVRHAAICASGSP